MPIRLPPEPVQPRPRPSVILHEGPALPMPSASDARNAASSSAATPTASTRPTRGSQALALDIAASPEKRAKAMAIFADNIYAKTSKKSVEQRLRTWDSVARAAGHMDAFHLSPQLVQDVSAALKAAGYRSIAGYISAAHVQHVTMGHDTSELLALTLRQAKRAATRGQGPPTRAAALPLHRWGELPPGREPWAEKGPIYPALVLAVGAHWLLRPNELEALQLRHLNTRVTDKNVVMAELHIQRSKTDPTAKGCTKTLTCDYTEAHKPQVCPACLAHRLKAALVDNGGTVTSYILVTEHGATPTRAALATTIQAAATTLGLDTKADRYSAHSLRVSGASLHAGHGEEHLKSLGRWRSDAHKGYLRPGFTSLSSSTPMLPALVKATGRGGKVHWCKAPAPGFDHDMAAWKTECGWAFGLKPGAWQACEDSVKDRCPRCWKGTSWAPATCPPYSPSHSSPSDTTSSSESST